MYRYLTFLETYRLRYRNSQKRIYIRDACYSVTVKTHNNFPYFRERIFCDLFIENLKLCKRLKQFQLYGWVLIDDHFHLLVQPGDEFDYSKIIQFLKRHVSRNINIITRYAIDNISSEGDIGQCRLRVFGVLRHGDNWLHIYKFDQYVQKLKFKFFQKYPNNHPYPKFKWQRSFHDHFIRNEMDFDHHMEYIEYNLEKHCMSDDWQYVFTNEKYHYLTDALL